MNAYTDLLLHDMGPERADICFGLASPSEFRTEPLMGLRVMKTLLHDGKAQSVLPHDGPVALWPDPNGARVFEVGQRDVVSVEVGQPDRRYGRADWQRTR